MRRILCPIDFSEASINALDHAVQMAKAFQGTITLLHAYNEEEFTKIVGVPKAENLYGEAEGKLKRLVKEIKASVGEDLLEVHYMLRVGDLIDGILSYAEKEKSHLIVMGTTGVGSVSKAVFGSNTVKVFQEAACPVLCVPKNIRYHPVTKIVYATDYERNDEQVVKRVLALADELGAKVEVVHVDKDQNDAHLAQYSNYVQKLKTYLPEQLISFQRIPSTATVSQALDQYVKTEGAQILALLTHNRNLLQQILHRSITKDLAYFAHSALLIYKN